MNQLLPLLAFFSVGLLHAGNPLIYTIRPAGLRLQVTVEFDGTAQGITSLEYRDNQFGEPGQMAHIVFPEQAPGINVTKEPDSNRFVVRHLPGRRVQVVYEVLDLQGKDQFFYQYCCYKPIIRENWFHLQSGHFFATPKDYWADPDDRKPVEFRWEGFPPEQVLHNSFGPGLRQRVNLTNSEFSVAVFVGGDFRRYEFRIKEQPVYLITRGAWSQFTDDTLQNLLQRTVEGHRSFWQDFSDTLYTVTFLPIHDAPWSDTSKSVSVGGSGLTNSFMSYATNNPGVDYNLIRYIWVHELMHHWIGVKIQNAAEEKQYWFSEGFTEYFTLKNSLRYGLITPGGFLQELNSFSAEHYSSPVRHMPNDSLDYERFWNGGKEWEKLPYRRGCLYAFYLDNLLREKSKGEKNLDQFMRVLLAHVVQQPDQKIDHAFFMKMLRAFAGKSAVKGFESYIERGQLIQFDKTRLPEGVEVTIKDLKKSYGPSPEVVTRTEILKDIPVFGRKNGVSDAALKAALLR
jgi:predicted metalloprotease with PDZ domain